MRSLRLSELAERALCGYSWLGNVRELEHMISRAAVKALGRGTARDEIITLEAQLLDLSRPGLAPATLRDAAADASPATGKVLPRLSLPDSVAYAQRRTIQQALKATHCNWAAAARLLRIDPSNLHKLAWRLGLKGGKPPRG